MFEIGPTLRETRAQQRIGLVEAEQVTKIRSKYLQAIEDEDFDTLPGPVYTKGFLRTYADFLRLDGQLFVDEYNARYGLRAEAEDRAVLAARHRRRRRAPSMRAILTTSLMLLAAGLTTAIVLDRRDRSPVDPTDISIAPKQVTEPAPAASSTIAPDLTALPANVTVVTATRGDTWIEVRDAGPDGELLYSETLARGQSRQFTAPTVYMVVAQPASLTVQRGDQTVDLTGNKPVNVNVDNKGIRRQRS